MYGNHLKAELDCIVKLYNTSRLLIAIQCYRARAERVDFYHCVVF